jgi:hypothetical protein
MFVGGCAYLNDPYLRPGTYQPAGDNDANLQTTANPHDLVAGAPLAPAAGNEAAPPVADCWPENATPCRT